MHAHGVFAAVRRRPHDGEIAAELTAADRVFQERIAVIGTAVVVQGDRNIGSGAVEEIQFDGGVERVDELAALSGGCRGRDGQVCRSRHLEHIAVGIVQAGRPIHRLFEQSIQRAGARVGVFKIVEARKHRASQARFPHRDERLATVPLNHQQQGVRIQLPVGGNFGSDVGNWADALADGMSRVHKDRITKSKTIVERDPHIDGQDRVKIRP